MQALGIDVLFKGINMQRLLGGLWISLRISLIAVAFSIVLGLVVGVLEYRGGNSLHYRVYILGNSRDG